MKSALRLSPRRMKTFSPFMTTSSAETEGHVNDAFTVAANRPRHASGMATLSARTKVYRNLCPGAHSQPPAVVDAESGWNLPAASVSDPVCRDIRLVPAATAD